MDVFVARQPIFDRALSAIGYELLFRNSSENEYPDDVDRDEATQRVLSSWLFSIGMDRLTAGKIGFVNLSERLIVDDPGTLLDPQVTVFELDGPVSATPEIIEACRSLREQGFRIALEHFEPDAVADLVDHCDILKIDFTTTTPEDRAAIAQRFAMHHVSLLATRVETPDEFDEAKGLGFDLFQGHFFALPQIVQGKQLAVPKLHYLRVAQEINKTEFEFKDLAEVVHRDASLAYRLLRYINSAAFGWRSRIKSIQHALVLLGEREIRRWVTLAVLGSVAEDRPEELTTVSVIRGRFCELLAERLRMPDRAMDLFFLGMLSQFDVMVGRPMDEVLASIELADDVRQSLVDPDVDGPLRALLDMIDAYERADWVPVSAWCKQNRIGREVLPTLYVEAVEWADSLHRSKW